MSRFASALNTAAAEKRQVRMFLAVDLDFSSGHVRAHDGIGTYSWGGADYLGIGQLGSISLSEENTETVARPLSLTLSGVDSSLVTTTMTEIYQNRTAILYIGFIDLETNATIATPEIIWEGKMNQMSLSVQGPTCTIKLTCEYRLRREPRIARYTSADQTLVYSGDKFFDLVPQIPGYVGRWGQENVFAGGSAPGVSPGVDPRRVRQR